MPDFDTTSLHFEIEEDEGDKDGNFQGSQTAGKKSYVASRQRGHSKNGRGDVPQIVVGMAVTRDGLKQIQLALLSCPNGRVWQVIEPSTDAANRLKVLKIKPSKPILNLD